MVYIYPLLRKAEFSSFFIFMIRETFYDHLQYEKRYSGHTIQAYKCDLTQFETYLSNIYDIHDDTQVTYNMIRSWLASLIESGISPRSVNRKLSSLRAYFIYLLRFGFTEFNPMGVTHSLRVPERLPSFATEKEMEKVLKDDPDDCFSRQRDLMTLEIFYSTGVRLAELLQLKPSDVDYYSKTIKVTGKRNKQRIIPVSDSLLDKIQVYLKNREQNALPGVIALIINDKGEAANRMFIYKMVKESLSEAGVTGTKSPHVLRHTFATHMLNEGADLNAIKELLGHSSLASTQVYTHTNVEKLKSIYKLAHPWAQKKEEL